MRNGIKRDSLGHLCLPVQDVPPGLVTDRERPVWRDSVWQKIGRETYVTCPKCRSINRITNHVRRKNKAIIQANGRISICVTCVYCEVHFYVLLLGWKGASVMYCSYCGRKEEGPVRKFKEWDLLNGCCPKCLKRRQEGMEI